MKFKMTRDDYAEATVKGGVFSTGDRVRVVESITMNQDDHDVVFHEYPMEREDVPEGIYSVEDYAKTFEINRKRHLVLLGESYRGRLAKILFIPVMDEDDD